jgi:sec-independent protein translocase protein TatB
MLNLGFFELLVIFTVLIVVVGPEKLPAMLRSLGRGYGKLMRMSDEFRRAILVEADKEDAERRAESFRKRREEARRIAEEARKASEEGTAAAAAAAPEGGDGDGS